MLSTRPATGSVSGRLLSNPLIPTLVADQTPGQPPGNTSRSRPSQARERFTLLDNLLLIAGFGCGFFLHQNSAFRHRVYYYFTVADSFRSSLGSSLMSGFWALIVGLVFVIVARCFRYRSQVRPAEWLAVLLAILLAESAVTAILQVGQGRPHSVFVRANSRNAGTPRLYRLTPHDADVVRERSRAFSREATAAWIIVTLIGCRLRKRMGPGAFAILLIALASLFLLGPVRWLELLSTEYTAMQPIPVWAGRPKTIFVEVNMPISLYRDAHAWLAYSLRVLFIWFVAIIATTDLWKRRRVRSPLELAAFASALAIACCWLADEFVTRPAHRSRGTCHCAECLAGRARSPGGGIGRRLGNTDTSIAVHLSRLSRSFGLHSRRLSRRGGERFHSGSGVVE